MIDEAGPKGPALSFLIFFVTLMIMRKILYMTFLAAAILQGCSGNKGGNGLNAEQFSDYWTVESESPDYQINFRGDTCEIVSPKGLTLWFNEKLSGNIEIEYEATVFDEREGDRLSDLNCFWMATDPKAESIFDRMDERNGVFANCASMKLYYVGYGGNWNSTTRFRRYTGEPDPAIIKEYSDSSHLLRPNHWYDIKLVCNDGNVEYWIDGELLFEYADSDPYTEGWFGFRTTLSRTGIRNFRVKEI